MDRGNRTEQLITKWRENIRFDSGLNNSMLYFLNLSRSKPNGLCPWNGYYWCCTCFHKPKKDVSVFSSDFIRCMKCKLIFSHRLCISGMIINSNYNISCIVHTDRTKTVFGSKVSSPGSQISIKHSTS